jgi:uncharacterized membrane protein YfcA
MWKCARIAFPASAIFAFVGSFSASFSAPDPMRWWHVWIHGCVGTAVLFAGALLACGRGLLAPGSIRQMLRDLWDNDSG